MTNVKLKIAMFVLAIGIIIIGGWWIWNNSETKIEEKDIVAVAPATESGNYISISHSEKDDENVLLFDVNIQEYLVESADLSKLSEEDLLKYKKLGSKYIASSEFNYTQGIPLLEIKTGNDSLECKPIIHYLEIEMILPPDAEVRGELLGFVEDKMEEKIEIMPSTSCISSICSDCPNYTKEDDFFPSDISIHADVQSLRKETLARVYLPLTRHNPATRKTYTIKEAKIKVIYKLNENNALLFEEENVPDEVDTPKFNVSYKITNPSATKFSDLKIKIDLDNEAVVSFSEKFDIKEYESKIISFQTDSTSYFGNFFMFPYVMKSDKVIATGQRKRIWFSKEAVKAIETDKIKEAEMLNLINQEREKRNLPKLILDEKIGEVARSHALDSNENDLMSHINSEGESLFDRLKKGGVEFSIAEENIGFGEKIISTHKEFMNSSPHSKKILSVEFKRVGIGVADLGRNRIFVVQNFTD